MSLPIMQLTPDSAGYTATNGKTLIQNQLAGGAPRTRKDQLNAAALINVKWTLNPADYAYAQAFFRTVIQQGSLPFSMSLILDSATPSSYNCQIVDGTWGLASQEGLEYVLACQMYVTLPAPDVLYDTSLVAMYSTYASGDASTAIIAALAALVNHSLPVAI